MRKSRTVLLAPALVALALAACGSSDEAATDGTASPQASGQDAMVEFARCMREHGVDMPDPGSDGRVMIGPDDVDTGSQEFQDAQEACQGILDGAVQAADGGGVSPELEEQFLEMARCLREKGFDVPDPQIGRAGQVQIGGGETPAFDPGDPEFRAASEECGREVDLPQPGEPVG